LLKRLAIKSHEGAFFPWLEIFLPFFVATRNQWFPEGTGISTHDLLIPSQAPWQCATATSPL